MSDRITPEGCCTTCGKILSEFEVNHEICISCGGYPIHEACGGQGCRLCTLGEIRPTKNNKYEFN